MNTLIRQSALMVATAVVCGLGVMRAAESYRLPLRVATLANGLTVAVSEDHTHPTIGLSVVYKIGFRLEPKGRGGFAHLFEHMMFEGTRLAPHGTLERVIEGGGGQKNGHTRYDYTEFVENAPLAALEPMLWLEADRMVNLTFSPERLTKEIAIVKEEYRTNVQDRPYGLFYAIDLPRLAFERYGNAHNFYGDFAELDAATVQEAQTFYRRYYGPNNAVLAIAGDVTSADAMRLARKYFGGIPRRPTPSRPDVREPAQGAEKRAEERDEHATFSGITIGYRLPPRTLDGVVRAALIGHLLHQGHASRLYQALVQKARQGVDVVGGVNWPQGNQWAYGDPILMTSFITVRPDVSTADILRGYDAVVRELQETPLSPAELDQLKVTMQSDWYDQIENPQSRAALVGEFLACAGSADEITRIPEAIERVSAEDLRAFAARHLVPANRSIIIRLASDASRPPATRP